jgi:hypothetical protein
MPDASVGVGVGVARNARGCACSVAALGFVWGLFTRSKRGCRAQGDIGRLISVGEREKIKKRKEHGALSPECAGQRALPAKLSVVEGRFVCLCLHAPAGLAHGAAGTSETRRALVNHSGGHVGIDPTAAFMCRVLAMSLHSPSLSIPSPLSRSIYVMSAV